MGAATDAASAAKFGVKRLLLHPNAVHGGSEQVPDGPLSLKVRM
jgi:hypothetical protein